MLTWGVIKDIITPYTEGLPRTIQWAATQRQHAAILSGPDIPLTFAPLDCEARTIGPLGSIIYAPIKLAIPSLPSACLSFISFQR